VSRIVCVGEAFVDLLAESEMADVGASETFLRAAGGAVANVAIGLARLGASVAFVGTVGRDPFGTFLLRTLAHENVNVDGVRSVDEKTSVVVVSRGPGGARDFYPLNSPGAESRLTIDDLDRGLLAKAQCVHFGGVVLAAQPGRSACMAAAASGAGLVTFDLNVRPRIFADALEMRRVIAEGCAAADLVKCSQEDLAALSLDEAEPATLLGGRTRAAIVTLGALGCRWATSDGASGEAVGPRVTAVDTTGAGDAFMAAALWRLCHAHQGRIDAEAIADAARWAVVAGALACQKAGAIASLPRADELEVSMRTKR
jgi:fructokinase